jgi:hypothetical protein
MNLDPAPPIIQPRARRRWLWVGLLLLLLPLIVLGGIALGVASYFQLSSDTSALRNGLMKASGVEWRQQLGLNIGRGTFGAVRTGLSLVPLEPEVRAAVQAARGVEVGIYELASGSTSPDRAAMLAAADQVLSARGWERLVGVLDGDELVSVYVPGETISMHNVKCCVFVFDGRQMVVVSARVDVEPLRQCLRNKSDLRAKVRSCGWTQGG